jgi:probable HAF family extracellular repeat protein
VINGYQRCPGVESNTVLLHQETAHESLVRDWIGDNQDIGLASVGDEPEAINASNEIVGYFINGSNIDQAFLYSNGTTTNISNNSLFPGGTRPLAISKSGQVVGVGYKSSSVFHTFLYSGGTMTDLGAFGGTQSQPFAINDSGVILTEAEFIGEFLYSNGIKTVLGTPSGVTSANGYVLNNNNEVAGELSYSTGTSHAAKWVTGV